MSRSEEEIRRIYAEKDTDERDQQILHFLANGASCEEITNDRREREFCRRIEPGVREQIARGVDIDTSGLR